MIIKEADDKTPDIAALRALLTRPDCSPETGKRIDKEIRNMQAGIRAEADAAYEMKVHWGAGQNIAIIHDLRIEHAGLVAQIDHLIINRFLQIWVCESKSFSEGIGINEHGEFAAFYGGKPYGVPSPIEQNLKHILILQRMFDTGVMPLPTRLGFKILPDLKSLVIVSKGARISRPTKKVEGLDRIVKSDQVYTTISQTDQSALLLAKVISQDTLAEFARDVTKEHRPIQMNWTAKFGFSAGAAQPAPVVTRFAPSASPAIPIAPISPFVPIASIEPTAPALPVAPSTPDDRARGHRNLVCFRCGTDVGYDVAKFCRFNKPRFGGNIFCRACQSAV